MELADLYRKVGTFGSEGLGIDQPEVDVVAHKEQGFCAVGIRTGEDGESKVLEVGLEQGAKCVVITEED